MRKRLWIILLLAAGVLSVHTPAGATNHQRAVDYYNRAVRLKGSTNDPVLLLKKEQLYQRAIELWPGFPEAHNNLADVYEKEGRDETTGEEKLYLLVSARSIKAEIEGLSLKESAQRAVRAFGTRAIYIVKAPREDAPVPQAAVSHAQQDPHSIDAFLERIEGEGAWVRVVRFEHE